ACHGRRGRNLGGNQLDGRLLQATDRITVGVAIDAPVRRIRCIARDARGFERLGVEPQTMSADVGEYSRPVVDRGVELSLGRNACGYKRPVAPSGCVNPRSLLVLGCALLDESLIIRDGVPVIERTTAVAETTPDRVGMGIDKRREDEFAVRIDQLCFRAD